MNRERDRHASVEAERVIASQPQFETFYQRLGKGEGGGDSNSNRQPKAQGESHAKSKSGGHLGKSHTEIKKKKRKCWFHRKEKKDLRRADRNICQLGERRKRTEKFNCPFEKHCNNGISKAEPIVFSSGKEQKCFRNFKRL